MTSSIGPAASSLWARDQRVVSQALKQRYYPFAYAGGEGGWLIDVDGRRYLDFSAGWAVANLGY